MSTGAILNGRFRLEHLLGSGGFAEVYGATDLRLRRTVAIKLLHPHLVRQAGFVERFEREAQTVAHLRHPHILGIHDYGEAADSVYLVMPLVGGGSLDRRLARSGPLNPAATARFIRPIADALDYAHRQSIIHRDVKPQNILLDEDSLPLLTDFGLAALLTSSEYLETSAVKGTVAYMAPEQFEGRASPASDVYALGCLLFQLLTGTLPYTGTMQEVMYGHLAGAIPSVTARSGGRILTGVDAILTQALDKNPARRFASAGALARAFAAATDETQRLPRLPAPLPAASSIPPPSPGKPPLALVNQPTPDPTAPGDWILPVLIALPLVVIALVSAIVLMPGARGSTNPPPTARASVAALAPTATLPGPSVIPTVTTTNLTATATSQLISPTTVLTPTPTPQPSATAPSGRTRNLSVESVGLTFSIPSDWQEISNEAGHFRYSSPDGRAQIVVRWSDQVPSGVTARSLIEQELEDTAAADPSFDPTTVPTGNVTIGGHAGFGSEIYTFSSSGGERVSEADRAVVLPGRAQYFFGFLALESAFDSYAATFDEIIDSVQITGP